MKYYHKNRMIKLADHLETVPPDNFDMGFWKCGTKACAIGHGCTIPSFRRAGLHLSILEDEPIYKNLHHYDAIAEFFGIPFSDAVDLFSTNNANKYLTPHEMALHIREYLRTVP